MNTAAAIKKLRLVCLTLVLLGTAVNAQSKKVNCKVQVSGYAESLRLAYLDATNKAFYELIAQCGGGIKVSSTAIDEVKATSSEYQANSYESMLVGLEGLVSNFAVLDSSKSSIENGRYIRVDMTARANVHLDSARSPILSIAGISPEYKDGELLEFEVNANEEVYLWIYQVKDDRADLFFPHEKYLPEIVLRSNETFKFPPLGIPVRARLDEKFTAVEVQNLVFIAAKRKETWEKTMDLNALVERYSAQKGQKDIKVIKVAITR